MGGSVVENGILEIDFLIYCWFLIRKVVNLMKEKRT